MLANALAENKVGYGGTGAGGNCVHGNTGERHGEEFEFQIPGTLGRGVRITDVVAVLSAKGLPKETAGVENLIPGLGQFLVFAQANEADAKKFTLAEFKRIAGGQSELQDQTGTAWKVSVDSRRLAEHLVERGWLPEPADGGRVRITGRLEFRTASVGASLTNRPIDLSVELPHGPRHLPSDFLFHDLEFEQKNHAPNELLNRANFDPFPVQFDALALQGLPQLKKRPGSCVQRRPSDEEGKISVIIDTDAPYRFKLEPLVLFQLAEDLEVHDEFSCQASEFELATGAFWNDHAYPGATGGFLLKDALTVCELATDANPGDGSFVYPRRVASMRASAFTENGRRFVIPHQRKCALCLDLSVLGYDLEEFRNRYLVGEDEDKSVSIIYANGGTAADPDLQQKKIELCFSDRSAPRLVVYSPTGDRALVFRGAEVIAPDEIPEILVPSGDAGTALSLFQRGEARRGFEVEAKTDDAFVHLEHADETLAVDGSATYSLPAYGLTIPARITASDGQVFNLQVRKKSAVEEIVIGIDIGTQAVAMAEWSNGEETRPLQLGSFLKEVITGSSAHVDEAGEDFLFGSRIAVSLEHAASGMRLDPAIDQIVAERAAIYQEAEKGAGPDVHLEKMSARTSFWKEQHDVHIALSAEYDSGSATVQISDVKSPVGAGETLSAAGPDHVSARHETLIFHAGSDPQSCSLGDVRTEEMLASVLKQMLCGILQHTAINPRLQAASSPKLQRRLVIVATYPASFPEAARNRYLSALSQCVEILKEKELIGGSAFFYTIPEGLALIHGVEDDISSRLENGLGKAIVVDIGAGTVDVSAMNFGKYDRKFHFFSQDLSFSVPLGGRLLDEAIRRDIEPITGRNGLDEKTFCERIESAKRTIDARTGENDRIPPRFITINVGQDRQHFQGPRAINPDGFGPGKKAARLVRNGDSEFIEADLQHFFHDEESNLSAYFAAFEDFILGPVLDHASQEKTILIISGRCSLFPEFRTRLEAYLNMLEYKDKITPVYLNDEPDPGPAMGTDQ